MKMPHQTETFLRNLGVDPQNGLNNSEVQQSRQLHGANRLTPPAKDPLWKQYFGKFKDPTIIILCICAAIAILIKVLEGEVPWDGVAILAAVAIATGGSTFSEYKAEKAFELLKEDSDKVQVRVRRNGEVLQISSQDLVVGDIILLEPGDKIPADSILIEAFSCKVDQSMWNGESLPTSKNEKDFDLIGGTTISEGNATAVVISVGDKTRLGNLASALGQRYICPNAEHRQWHKEEGKCPECGQELVLDQEPQTPLQKKLSALVETISKFGTYAAVAIFIALIASTIISQMRSQSVSLDRLGDFWPLLSFAVLGLLGLKILTVEKKFYWLVSWAVVVIGLAVYCWTTGHRDDLEHIIQSFMIAITIIVVAVPEGLPMVILIALGLGMRKIRQDNNLVRKMVATETVGSTTIICSDKTGTLTLNRMTVQRLLLSGKMYRGSDMIPEALSRLLHESIGCNTTADLSQAGDIGSATESALLRWLKSQQCDYQKVRSSAKLLTRRPFTTELKWMGSTISKSGRCITFFKGAPERLLAACTSVHTSDGEIPLDGQKGEIESAITEMTRDAIRPLAICYRVEGEEPKADSVPELGNLTFLALVGIADQIRADVPSAITRCQGAGIAVMMITGDHPETARAIAKELGMIRDGDVVLTQDELTNMGDDQVLQILPRLRVLSRAHPVEGKARLVRLLQQVGHVVAMTGDGTNDAPALKKADVGISMGIRGTEVAKSASDIVLTDDNFTSIVSAVKWGRTIFENIQRFLQFQLTVNVSVLALAFLSPILATLFPGSGFKIQPVTILQFLWINLIMDTLAAIAFGLEPPRPEVMRELPRGKNEPILTSTLKFNILSIGVYISILLLAMQVTDLAGLSRYKSTMDPEQFALMNSAVLFSVLVFVYVFNMFNARSILAGKSAFTNISKSRSFFFIMALVILMQILLVQFGGKAVTTAPLPLSVWIRIITICASVVVFGEITRLVQKPLLSRPVMDGKPAVAA